MDPARHFTLPLCLTGKNELRIDLTDFENMKYFAKYESFRISQASESYTLVLGDMVAGDAGRYWTYS